MMLKLAKFVLGIIVCVAAVLSINGCATAPYARPTLPAAMPGIYHRVEKGQTLWKISKIYAVDLDELARINHIPDSAKIEIGQQIFVANRLRPAVMEVGASEDFIWPIRGRVISTFGQTYNSMINKGINILPSGSSEVVAVRQGKVIFCGEDLEGFGKTIIIDHGNGLMSVYTRNAQVLVRAGDQVQKGSVIARAGSAGRDKNTYLHFEIRKGHIPQNPYYYLP